MGQCEVMELQSFIDEMAEGDTACFSTALQKLELALLLEALYSHYGYDFSGYSLKMLSRRIQLFMSKHKLHYISELIPALLYNEALFKVFLKNLSITVTEFFRDPLFFKCVNKEIVPLLKSYPFINIWCAGCATGEEAYSWAILMNEAGLLDRCRIYATDINHDALLNGKEGIYNQDKYEQAMSNYKKINPCSDLHDCLQSKYGSVKLADKLIKSIVFSSHNLIHDGVFGEMNVISCRNVMIYFSEKFKKKCFKLFNSSLVYNGFLCLGDCESYDAMLADFCFGKFKNTKSIFQLNKVS